MVAPIKKLHKTKLVELEKLLEKDPDFVHRKLILIKLLRKYRNN